MVHQYPQIGAQIVALGVLELLQDTVVQVVKNGIVLRPQSGEAGVLVDALAAVDPIDQVVQILHGVPVDLRQDLAEKLLQKLKMGGVGAGLLSVGGLIVL